MFHRRAATVYWTKVPHGRNGHGKTVGCPLFIRGWEIQTHAGVTFTERVNQWIYRFLYCAGTTAIVCSLAWPQC